MYKYVWRDLLGVLRYLPFGVIAGVAAFLFGCVFRRGRRGSGEKPGSFLARLLFSVYVALILCITLFSREAGEIGTLDLKLFSTWGINDRNNAYVAENILLFLPLGLIAPWAYARYRNFVSALLLGAVCSLFIELLQFVTGRGIFQVDDILTNVLGMLIGFFLYYALWGAGRLGKKLLDSRNRL